MASGRRTWHELTVHALDAEEAEARATDELVKSSRDTVKVTWVEPLGDDRFLVEARLTRQPGPESKTAWR